MVEKTVIRRVGYLGSFVAAISLFAYIAVWLLMVGVLVGVSALIGVFALLLMA